MNRVHCFGSFIAVLAASGCALAPRADHETAARAAGLRQGQDPAGGQAEAAAPDASPSTWTAFQLGFYGKNNVQLFDMRDDVYGLRLNLFSGRNQNVYGLDLGLVNEADKNAGPLQLGVFVNKVAGSAGILQLAGFANRVGVPREKAMKPDCSMVGVQVSALVNMGNIYGIQVAYQNGLNALQRGNTISEFPGFLYGIQIGGANAATDTNGVQVGALFNFANDLAGLQLAGLYNQATDGGFAQVGLVNSAEALSGVQVGLYNTSKKGVRGLQIGLWNKNPKGFVSQFPLFNFGSG